MLKLYGYWRSSAAYRVRIALNLKNVAHDHVGVNIAPGANEQKDPKFAALNPQERVPIILAEGEILCQSMAILEWLEECYPESPILPQDIHQRSACRAFANVIACDIHPLNNLSVLTELEETFQATPSQISAWYADWIHRGFRSLERTAAGRSSDFLFGETPSLAEICLLPQMWNARRFEVELTEFPNLLAVEAVCQSIKAFQDARPEVQSDAP